MCLSTWITSIAWNDQGGKFISWSILIAWIYDLSRLSVHFVSDIQRLFLPIVKEEHIVKVFLDRPFTVPCRVSNPQYESDIQFGAFINVEAYKGLTKYRTHRYEPNVGFTFEVQEEGKIIPDLQFRCFLFAMDDYTQQEFILLYVGGELMLILKQLS